MGDFNVDTRKRNSPKCKHLFAFIKKTKLKYLQTKPTYFHPHGKSTLDHVYTNCMHVSEFGVVNDMYGDHAPVYVIKKQAPAPKKVMKEIVGRSYKNYSAVDVSEYVNNTEWDCMDASTTGMCYVKLITKIVLYLDNNHPIKCTSVNVLRPDGFTREVEVLIRKKKRLLGKSRRVPNGMFNEHLPAVRKMDKKVQSILTKKRRNDIRSKLDKFADDPKRFWAEVNTVWKGPRSETILSLKDDNNVKIDSNKTADFVNTYYVSIGRILADAFVVNQPPSVDDDIIEINRPNFILRPIDLDMAKKLIGGLKVGKSSSIPNIRSVVIRDVLKTKPELLCKLVNSSIDNAFLP